MAAAKVVVVAEVFWLQLASVAVVTVVTVGVCLRQVAVVTVVTVGVCLRQVAVVTVVTVGVCLRQQRQFVGSCDVLLSYRALPGDACTTLVPCTIPVLQVVRFVPGTAGAHHGVVSDDTCTVLEACVAVTRRAYMQL